MVVGLVVLFVLGTATLVWAGAAKHWLCRKCGQRVFKESRPSLSGCKAGGTHSWVVDY